MYHITRVSWCAATPYVSYSTGGMVRSHSVCTNIHFIGIVAFHLLTHTMYTICKLFYINARTHARAPTLIDIHNHTQYKCSEYWKLIIQSDLKKKSQPNTTYYLKTRILLKSHLDELKHKDITKVTFR